MKQVLFFLSLLFCTISLNADDYEEFYNVVSDDFLIDIQDTPIERTINSGTIIIPEFDDTCPEEMKAPFSYACKIVEEYILPCLPLRVHVSVDNFLGSQKNALSKVGAWTPKGFGNPHGYANASMTTIKGVILGELCYGSDATFLKHVYDTNFLTGHPDIKITYNKQKLNEIYYSLDTDTGEKYDFVTLVIRDLLQGFGIYHTYRYNPVTNELQNPPLNMTPFEVVIDKALGKDSSPSERLANATKGELVIYPNLKLYAPTNWTNGTSLNYFIPNESYKISQILSYDFCKGIVNRSLDENSNYLFEELLGWKYDFVVGIGGNSPSSGGNTKIKMDYNGTFNIDDYDSNYGISTIINNNSKHLNTTALRINNDSILGHIAAVDYVNQFFPFQTEIEDYQADGVSVSILKKDGTWDLVFFIGVYVPGMPIYFKMSDCTFHYDSDEYARTIEGYLKARLTTKFITNFGNTQLNSKFFVIDYLPQKIKLGYNFITNNVVNASNKIASTAATGNKIRLYFSDAEGVDYIILECLKQGSRLPNKILVNDIKKGYFDVTIYNTTTFTAVGYNENGHTRGVPVTVEYQPATEAAALSFDMQNDVIMVKAGDETVDNCNYSIAPLTVAGQQAGRNGMANGAIDISTLADGLYVLTAIDEKSGLQGTFKFRK